MSPSDPSLDPAPPSDEPPAAEPVRVPLALEDWATVLIMAALALITLANVLVRYFTDASFAWTEEVSVFLMILLVLVGVSAATARERHIRIDFFLERGSPARRRRLQRLGAAALALLFGLIAALSLRVVWDDYRFGETSPGIGVPQWWYTIWLPLVSAAVALRALGLWWRRRGDGGGSGDGGRAP